MENFKFTSVDPLQLRQNLRRFPYFEDMIGKAVDVFLVSPLLNFSFNEMYLNRVSDELTKFLRSKKFQRVEGALITSANPSRLPCVSIKVMEGPKVVFCAYMMGLSTVAHGPHTTLPLFCRITNTKRSLGESVTSYLENKFCCSVKSCQLSDVQFQWLMGIAINETLMRNMNEGITIVHTINENGDKVYFVLEAETLQAVWDECLQRGGCKTRGVDLNWSSISSFTLAIHDHFHNTYGWNNISASVDRAVVEGASIALLKTLSLKITDGGLMFVLLKFLDETVRQSDPIYSALLRY